MSKSDSYALHPSVQQALTLGAYPLPTMVIGLLAPFTRLLLKGGCQHDPCLVGDFLRVAVAQRPAKSLKGFCRAANICGVLHDQMAKHESVERLYEKWFSGGVSLL